MTRQTLPPEVVELRKQVGELKAQLYKVARSKKGLEGQLIRQAKTILKYKKKFEDLKREQAIAKRGTK